MPNYPGSSKNNLRSSYGSFVAHFDTCRDCDVLGLQFCDRGKELRTEARTKVLDYLEHIDERIAEMNAPVVRGSESRQEIDADDYACGYGAIGWFG